MCPYSATGRAFTKPVDRLVGEAIADWERVLTQDTQKDVSVPLRVKLGFEEINQGFL